MGRLCSVEWRCRRIGAEWVKPANTGHLRVQIAFRLADVHRLHYYADMPRKRVKGLRRVISRYWRPIDC